MGHRDNLHRLRQAFGTDSFDLAEIPARFSNVMLARLTHGDERGCSFCFPHGIETINSRGSKGRRSWKLYRLHQYRVTPDPEKALTLSEHSDWREAGLKTHRAVVSVLWMRGIEQGRFGEERHGAGIEPDPAGCGGELRVSPKQVTMIVYFCN